MFCHPATVTFFALVRGGWECCGRGREVEVVAGCLGQKIIVSYLLLTKESHTVVICTFLGNNTDFFLIMVIKFRVEGMSAPSKFCPLHMSLDGGLLFSLNSIENIARRAVFT